MIKGTSQRFDFPGGNIIVIHYRDNGQLAIDVVLPGNDVSYSCLTTIDEPTTPIVFNGDSEMKAPFIKNGPTINNEPHTLVLLRIKSVFNDGRPKEAEILYDDQTVELIDGMRFITAFVPTATIKKAN